MKRVYLRMLLLTGGVLLAPAAIYAASFQGPGSGCTPPNCNVPGVIWNMQGTGQTQTGAEVRVDGTVTAQGTVVGSDILMVNTKAFRVDQNGPSAFYMGNWGGAGGTAKPLSFTVYGDTYVDRVNPYVGAGLEGRVQARKYCFYPGNPGDCITSWGGAGLYVAKTGDAMSGELTINTTTSSAITAVSSLLAGSAGTFVSTGVAGSGIKAYGFADNTAIGGTFSGRGYGIYVTSSNPGGGSAGYFQGQNGIAVYPNSVNVGTGAIIGTRSFFPGSGVSAYGGSIGVFGEGENSGSNGVYGSAAGSNGRGVVGVASSSNAWGGVFQYASNVPGSPSYPPNEIYADSVVKLGGELIGASVSGTTGISVKGLTGVTASASNIGVNGEASNSSGYGVQGYNDYYGSYGRLGYSNYGVYGAGSWWGGLFYGSTAGVRGEDTDTNTYGIVGYNNYSLYGNGNIYVSGDITATANTLSSCSWTAYVADGTAITCPSTNPLMSGIQRSGTSMRAYCCDL